jgi:NTE family protein
MELAGMATRLKRIREDRQDRLINWGYAVCDAAVRTFVDKQLSQGAFPYAGGV